MKSSAKKRVLLALITCVPTVVAARLCHASQAERQPMQPTPMTQVELLQALRDGHVKVFGEEPSQNRLSMAWAQVAFENGQGKWSWNHNLGNVNAVNSQAYFVNPADRHHYRAFDSFVDGAEAYWNTVRHCTAAVKMFDAGAPSAAAGSLKRCGYFEADLEPYARAMASLFSLARHDVFKKEIDERRQQQELFEATHCELVQLIEAAATRRACFGPCDD